MTTHQAAAVAQAHTHGYPAAARRTLSWMLTIRPLGATYTPASTIASVWRATARNRVLLFIAPTVTVLILRGPLRAAGYLSSDSMHWTRLARGVEPLYARWNPVHGSLARGVYRQTRRARRS